MFKREFSNVMPMLIDNKASLFNFSVGRIKTSIKDEEMLMLK
jgi:hypothetical protein